MPTRAGWVRAKAGKGVGTEAAKSLFNVDTDSGCVRVKVAILGIQEGGERAGAGGEQQARGKRLLVVEANQPLVADRVGAVFFANG